MWVAPNPRSPTLDPTETPVPDRGQGHPPPVPPTNANDLDPQFRDRNFGHAEPVAPIGPAPMYSPEDRRRLHDQMSRYAAAGKFTFPTYQPVQVTNPQMPWWAALLMAVLAALPGIVAAVQGSNNATKLDDARHIQETVVIPKVHMAQEEAAAARQEIGKVRTMMRPPVLDFPEADRPKDGRHTEPPKP